MEEKLIELKESLKEKLKKVNKEADILNIKSEYIGKKSEIANILSHLKDMSIEDKKKYGSLINNTKKELEELVNNRLEEIENKSIENLVEQIDLHSDKGRDIELASIDISVEEVK